MTQDELTIVRWVPDWVVHLVFVAGFLVASMAFYREMRRGRKKGRRRL
jgi:hypothetical protein